MRLFQLLLSLFLILVTPIIAYAETQIASIEIENGTHTSTQQIRKVLPLREGDSFDAAKVEQAISYLKKWGLFQVIDVEKKRGPKGVHLRFILKEGYLIDGIDIRGGYPYLSTRLRRMITVHPGELYDPAVAKEQEEKLAAFYERNGYQGTEVQLTPRLNEKKGTAELVYRVQKGKRYRLGTITVTGNHVFPHSYFVSQLNPLLLYGPERFRRSLEKIRDDYKKKGYLKARIRVKEMLKDPWAKKIHPALEVIEGKQVTVVFEGNKRISRRTFKQIAPIFTEGGYGEYEIQSSVHALLDAYQKIGFQEVKIKTETKDSLIRFLISEGPQTRVKKIRIEGNQKISDRQIKKELLTRENSLFNPGFYQPRTIEQDSKDLPILLHKKGAMENEFLGNKTTLNSFHDKAEVTFSVREGEITQIGEIQFIGNEYFSAGKLNKQLSLREGDPLNLENLNQDQEAITILYANSGFPYAKVTHEISKNTHEGGGSTLIYHIEEGIPVKIGEILIAGNERTHRRAIEKDLALRPGQPFSYRKILDSQRSLRKTGSFRNVNIETIGLAEKEPVVPLLIKLEEYRSLLLDAGVTYDTDTQFTGNLTLSHLNLFGAAKNGILKLTGGRDIQKGEAILKDSRFIGYNLEATLNSLVEHRVRPGFTTTDGGGSLSFLREFTPRSTFLGRYAVTRTFFTDVVDATGLIEEDHTTSKFSFSFNYDNRDSFADPQRGFVGFAGLDVSNKIIASTFNFVQPKGHFADYRSFRGRVTLLNFIRIEGIKVFGGDTLTRDEKLFLGGDYSVRGFNQDAIGPTGTDGRPAGGQLLLALTTELQTRIYKDLKLALFVDHGSISNGFSDFGLASLRHSAGFGLRYVTPVGPLRLDYGIKLDQEAGESFGRLHFAFGYAF